MTIQEMIKQALEHEHEPNGESYWLVKGESYSMKSARCKCGIELVQESAPIGSPYNWQEWRVSK